MVYRDVVLDHTDNYDRLVMRSPVVDNEQDIREIPVQAIADRMEVYGLESVEHSLEFIGRSSVNSGVNPEDLSRIVEDYTELATRQYVRMHQGVAQLTGEPTPTVLLLDGPEAQIRGRLDNNRRRALRHAGVHTPPDEECCPGVGITRESVPSTRDAACNALNCTSEVFDEAVRLVLEEAGMQQLMQWRYYRMAMHVPRMTEDEVIRAYLSESGM